MTNRFDLLSPESRALLKPEPHPNWVAPMLATLTDRRFDDPRWIFERKLDGERCLAFRNGNRIRLLSRKQQNLNGTYPEVADALLAEEPDDFVVDGEVVAFEHGQTSFERLQQRMGIKNPEEARRSGVAVFYYLFDLLHLDGFDTRELPLRDRKRLLRNALLYRRPLRFTTHRNTEGEAAYAYACAHGWEGVIAKLVDSTYVSRRSPSWLKLKCSSGQELVIGGFTDPAGSRIGFGALLVGYYEDGRFRYAGKVGTGYSRETLVNLRQRLDKLEIDKSPFDGEQPRERRVHWVRPELVAEVAFSEWTAAGKLRHPRFEGLRDDKSAKEVVRERPSHA